MEDFITNLHSEHSAVLHSVAVARAKANREEQLLEALRDKIEDGKITLLEKQSEAAQLRLQIAASKRNIEQAQRVLSRALQQ